MNFNNTYTIRSNSDLKIFFLEINFYTFIPIIFYRLIGYDIFFLDASLWWQKRIQHLNKFGIFWFNHQEYPYFSGGDFARDIHSQTIKLGKQLISMDSFLHLNNLAGKNANLESVIYQHVFSTLVALPRVICYLD